MRFTLALGLMLLAVLPARAEVPLDGLFTAATTCPAYQSINRQTNPGNVEIKPGEDYALVAGNREPPSHFQIVVPGASPERRWVAVDCGRTDAQMETPEARAPQQTSYRGTQYVLAVSWQPAFCETKPYVVECRAQTESSFEASNFALHGLWPQPRNNQFCDVPWRDQRASEESRWFDLPEVRLSASLRNELDRVMPGTRSALERHEWTKHGTCYGTDAEEYYADSLALMQALNGSAVVRLFADNIGRKITLRQVRQAFEENFGPGAGERVGMDCVADGNRIIISELTIGLTGDIQRPGDFAALIAAADPAGSDCSSGMVDPVGLR